MSKRLAKINKEYCAACGACTKVCPKGAISIYKGCYAAINAKLCLGCGMCSKECPAQAIAIETLGEGI